MDSLLSLVLINPIYKTIYLQTLITTFLYIKDY